MPSARRRALQLTKPQRARAHRVFRRVGDAAANSIGVRLVRRGTIMQGGEPQRWYATEELVDADMTYTLWMWAQRREDRHDP
jgi:hypothetical protein